MKKFTPLYRVPSAYYYFLTLFLILLLSQTTIFSSQRVDTPEVKGFDSEHFGNYDDSEYFLHYKVSNFNAVQVINTSYTLGGISTEFNAFLKLDTNGNIFLAGSTQSSDFPMVNSLNNTHGGGQDIFVMKISADQKTILWSTFLGANGFNELNDISLDGDENVVLTGTTESTNFPTVNSNNTSRQGPSDGFVVVISNDGTSFLLSTLIGGTGEENFNAVAVSSSGSEYVVTGYTNSTDFPISASPFNSTKGGDFDIFVSKVNKTGSILYSSFIGGEFDDVAYDVALDSTNNIYLVGETRSSNFTYSSILQDTLNGVADGFILKLDSTGQNLIYANLLGGSSIDITYKLALQSNIAYVSGETFSTNFPTTNGVFDSTFNGEKDVFVNKYSETGELLFSTLVGGSKSDNVRDLIIDGDSNILLAGFSRSTDFPLVNEFYDDHDLGDDIFLTILDSTGQNVIYSSFFGWEGNDQGMSLGLDIDNRIFVTGISDSSNMPQINPITNPVSTGQSDAFLLILGTDTINPVLNVTSNSSLTFQFESSGKEITFDVEDNDPQAKYQILINNTLQYTGNVSEQSVTYNLDELSVGFHLITIRAFDRSGNTVSSVVEVTITYIPNTITNSSSSEQQPTNNDDDTIIFLFLVIILGGAGISSVGALVLKRSKRNKITGARDISSTDEVIVEKEISEVQDSDLESISIDENETIPKIDEEQEKPSVDTEDFEQEDSDIANEIEKSEKASTQNETFEKSNKFDDESN